MTRRKDWIEERAWWASRGITWTDREWRRIRWDSRRKALRFRLERVWWSLRRQS